MSAPYLAPVALALLLSACTATNPPRTAAEDEVPRAQSQRAHAAPTAPAAASPAETAFSGPRVVFAPGSLDLPRTAGPLLDDIAAKLKADPQVNVLLVGHTEDLGSTEFSVAVATRCAQAVSQALVKRGVKTSQIRLQPRGHSKTASRQCTTAACKKQMRRVDIVMSSY